MRHYIYNKSCWRELGGGIALFCCHKWVGGLGPFGPAIKNHHTLLFKSDTMWKPIKTRKFDVICSDGGGLLTWGQSGVRGGPFYQTRLDQGYFQRYSWCGREKETYVESIIVVTGSLLLQFLWRLLNVALEFALLTALKVLHKHYYYKA